PSSDVYDSSQYLGHARACWYRYSTSIDDVWIDMPASIDPSTLRLVNGRDGLECAVRGTLEGSPCTQTMLDARTKYPTGGWVATTGGYRGLFYDIEQWISTRPSAGTVALFLVRRRAGATTTQPGTYEQLTGWVLQAQTGAPTSAYRYCQGAV